MAQIALMYDSLGAGWATEVEAVTAADDPIVLSQDANWNPKPEANRAEDAKLLTNFLRWSLTNLLVALNNAGNMMSRGVCEWDPDS
jgi:hypothetical protein